MSNSPPSSDIYYRVGLFRSPEETEVVLKALRSKYPTIDESLKIVPPDASKGETFTEVLITFAKCDHSNVLHIAHEMMTIVYSTLEKNFDKVRPYTCKRRECRDG